MGPARRGARRPPPGARRAPPPSTPHDALFKGTFSRVDDAAGLLRSVLPPAVLARLDLSTLALQPGSFVDQSLAGRHSDLLFSAALSHQPVLLYLLFEHQSRPDPIMAFRLLAYMVRIWEAHLARHPDAHHLPAILPVVLHHGPSGWRAAVSFEDLLQIDKDTLAAIGDYVPRFRFVLDDLRPETDEALKTRAMTALGRLALLCLRHGRNADEIVDRIAGWLGLVREARRAPSGGAALARIWRYIVAISGPRPEQVLRRLLATVDPRTEEEMASIESYLLQKGRREGKREGKREGLLEGQRRMLLNQLEARFGALPGVAEERIQAAGSAELRRWARRVLTAATLDEVLGRR